MIGFAYYILDYEFGYRYNYVWQYLGLTQSGQRCKRNAQTHSFFCKSHQDQAEQLDQEFRRFFGNRKHSE